MTIRKWSSNIFWLWVEHQSLILSLTSKIGWSSKVCCTNWYCQKCCVRNICTKTEWPCYMHTDKCYPIAFHDLPQVSMAGMIYWNQQKTCHLWSHSTKSNHCTQITLWFIITLIWVCLGKMWGPRNLTGANHIFSVYPQTVADVYLYTDIIVQNTHNWWRHTSAE